MPRETFARKSALPSARPGRATSPALMPLTLAAPFSPAFARTGFASLFATPAAAYFAASFIGLVDGSPRATFRFFFANAALFVASFDLGRFAFLFSRVLFFASSCHESFRLVA